MWIHDGLYWLGICKLMRPVWGEILGAKGSWVHWMTDVMIIQSHMKVTKKMYLRKSKCRSKKSMKSIEKSSECHQRMKSLLDTCGLLEDIGMLHLIPRKSRAKSRIALWAGALWKDLAWHPVKSRRGAVEGWGKRRVNKSMEDMRLSAAPREWAWR